MRNSRVSIKKEAPISAPGFQRLHKCWGGLLVVLGSFLLVVDIAGFIGRDEKLIVGIGIIICIICVVLGSLACHVGHSPTRCTLFCSGLLNVVGFLILSAITYLSFLELINRKEAEKDNLRPSLVSRLLYYRCVINIVSSLTGAILLLAHSFLACFNCSSCSDKYSDKFNDRFDSAEDDGDAYLFDTSRHRSTGGSHDLRPNLATAPPLELMEIDPRYSYNNYDAAPPTYDSCFQDGTNRYSVAS